MLRKLGYMGALLTCPCHIVFVAVLLGGTAAGAWLTAHTGLAILGFAAAFAFFGWLAMRPERAAVEGATCEACAPDEAPAPPAARSATAAGEPRRR